jgi:nucleotide-binding universal stress UspA family protein
LATSLSDYKKISKILVGVDGSEHSMNAADYAISFAVKYNSELILLYVIPVDLGLFNYSPPSIEEMEKEGQVHLDKIKSDALKIDKNLQVETELIASPSVVGGIVDFADKENIDLIVVGTKGRSGLKKLLLGSVASGIVKYAHCPVIISR